MNTFDIELVGIELTNTINAYYLRDLATGIVNANPIVNSLKKLGYYNIDISKEEETFMKGKIISWIAGSNYANIENINIIDLIKNIKATQDYALFTERTNRRIQRSNELNKYIDITDTYEFYSSLTLDELNILGY
jgi:hypothetical protein